MNGLPYYKAYPRDFIEGTIGMPFELKGAYRLVLDLIYMQGGKLPDDPRYIAGLLGCTVRKWKSLRDELVKMDKIQANDGLLSNYRAVSELETLAKLQDKQRENRTTPNKINELQSPRCDHTEPEPEPYKKDTEPNGSVVKTEVLSSEDEDEIDIAFENWNITAETLGLPQAMKLTRKRRSQLRQRLKENGGLDGWNEALVAIQSSPFLLGQSSSGWRADLDFLLQPSSFLKVIEGAYTSSVADGQITGECIEATKVFNTQQEQVDLETVQPGKTCDVILEFAGLWFAKKSFGSSWNVVQARVHPDPILDTYPEEYAFVDEQ